MKFLSYTDNIKVRFFEKNENSDIIWEDYGKFSENSDVHHQFGIVLKTPPYKDKFIQNPVKVQIQLIRPSDNCCSEPLDFRYVPVNRKRTFSCLSENEMIPTVIEHFEKKSHQTPDITSSNASTSGYESARLTPNPETGNTQNYSDCQEISVSATLSVSEIQELEYLPLIDLNALLPYYFGFENDNTLSENNCLKNLKSIIEFIKVNKSENEIQSFLRNLMTYHIEQGLNIFHECIENGTRTDLFEVMTILMKYNLQFVITSTSYMNRNCIHLLAERNDVDLLKIFTKIKFIDINAKDDNGNTPLHCAVHKGSEISVKFLTNECPSIIKLNEINNEGFTPLSLAAEINDFVIMKILIATGADPTIKNPLTGNNVLHSLALNEIRNVDIIKIIHEKVPNLIFDLNFKSKSFKDLCVENNCEDLIKCLTDEKFESIESDDEESDDYDDEKMVEDFKNVALEIDNEKFKIDNECAEILCNIFDNGKWRQVCDFINENDKIKEWENETSPTSKLLEYFKVI